MNEQIAELEKALEAVKESEEILRYIVRHDPNAIAIFDNNLNYLAVSERLLLDYNAKEQDILGKHFYDVFPELPQRWKDIHQRSLKGEILRNDDDCFERPDGTITYNRWECRPWHRITGEIGGMVLYSEVITERKLAERALQENEKKYRHLFSHNPQPMWICDVNSLTFIEVNNAALKLYGYAREEFMKMTLKDICPKDDIPMLINGIEQGDAYKNTREGIRHIKKNGEVIYVEIMPYPIEFNGVDACHVLIKDNTKRRLAEKALLESEAKYRAFFENSMDAILLTSPNGNILSANQAACNLFGYTREELIQIGRSGLEDATDPRLSMLLAERKVKGKVTGEVNFIRKDGVTITTEISSSLFFNHEGLEQSSMIIRDITEKKKAEKEIKFQADLLNNVGQAVIATDFHNSITYWNKAAEQIYGWTAQEVMGKHIMDFASGEFKEEKVLEIFKQVSQGQTLSNEMIMNRKDGSCFHASVFNSPIFDEKRSLIAIVGITSDITERKRTEETLKKLSSAVEQTIDKIIITDRQGRIEYVNKAFETISGYSSNEVIGKTPGILKSSLYDKAFYENLWQTILSGNVFRAEMINRKKNGELYYVEKTITPIVNKHNVITHFVGTGVEISERKRAEHELIKAKEKAEESDRLKSAFLANMSHEVRTPLNSIIGFSSLLADPDFSQEDKDEFISHIIKNGDALLNVISDIVDFSKIEAGEITLYLEEINLRKFINGIHQQYSYQAKERQLEFILKLPIQEMEPIIYADQDRLHQIFSNLISNALKFTHHGQLEIGYEVENSVVINYIRDSGIGIPKEYHDKIFDRFRQVEEEKTRKYGGNGLGLAITKNLVSLMDGRIWLESEPGKGSTFYFTMPRKQE